MSLSRRNSPYRVTEETIDRLFTLWRDPTARLNWNMLCVLPPWLRAWGSVFLAKRQPALLAVWENDELIGIAPYLITDDTVSFWGNSDVCDYLDVVVSPGKEEDFFTTVLHYLRQKRVTQVSFESLRPDSATMTYLPGMVESIGGAVRCEEEDVSVGINLPPSWDDYLTGLVGGKERHEVRRKMRRLHEAGQVRFFSVSNAGFGDRDCELFLQIFSANRSDKAEFMTEKMASYFRNIAVAMARENFLRLFFLELNDITVATSLCFDYDSTRYLYNSGYVDQYRRLSVGLLCKVLSIKDAIEHRLRRYDFLKGAEPYKSRLGGKPVQLYRCCAQIV